MLNQHNCKERKKVFYSFSADLTELGGVLFSLYSVGVELDTIFSWGQLA